MGLRSRLMSNSPIVPKWSAEEREDALSLVALHNGNAAEAAKEFSEVTGKEIPASTVRSWKRRHADRYEEIALDLQRRIKQRSAENHARLAERAAAVVDGMVGRLEREGHEIDIDKIPAAAKAVSVISGVHTDKAALLRGDASVIEHRSSVTYDQLARSLRAKGVELVIESVEQPAIESTAEEVTESEES